MFCTENPKYLKIIQSENAHLYGNYRNTLTNSCPAECNYKKDDSVIPLCWERNEFHHGEQILGLCELAALGGHSRGEVQTFWFSGIHWFHLFLKET